MLPSEFKAGDIVIITEPMSIGAKLNDMGTVVAHGPSYVLVKLFGASEDSSCIYLLPYELTRLR